MSVLDEQLLTPADLAGLPDEQLLTPDDVADLLRVKRRYVWRLGRDGELGEVVRVGKYVRYTVGGVRAYLDRGRRSPVRLLEPVDVGAIAARPGGRAGRPAPTVTRLRRFG